MIFIELIAFIFSIVMLTYIFKNNIHQLSRQYLTPLEMQYKKIADNVIKKEKELEVIMLNCNDIVMKKDKNKQQLLLEEKNLQQIEDEKYLLLEKEYLLRKKNIDKKIKILYGKKYLQELISIYLKTREKTNLFEEIEDFLNKNI